MTKHIDTMSQREIDEYMRMLAGATESIMPEGAGFIIVVFGKPKPGEEKDTHWIGSRANVKAVPDMLRTLAADVESRLMAN